MTPQEIFDTVVTHLAQQGRLSVGKFENSCRYRGLSGTKCAVGALIPDDLYFEKMEGKAVSHLFGCYSDIFPLWMKEQEYFLKALQLCHDRFGNWETLPHFQGALRRVARVYDLDDSIVDTADFSNFVVGGGA